MDPASKAQAARIVQEEIEASLGERVGILSLAESGSGPSFSVSGRFRTADGLYEYRIKSPDSVIYRLVRGGPAEAREDGIADREHRCDGLPAGPAGAAWRTDAAGQSAAWGRQWEGVGMSAQRTALHAYVGGLTGWGPEMTTQFLDMEARMDAGKRKRFSVGLACGSTCIAKGQTCRKPATLKGVAERLRKILRADALQARLDARRKAKVSPGQLGLDLTGAGGAGGAGGGPGTGKACGQSHISRAKTCRKGAGGAAPAPPAEASKPKATPSPSAGGGGAAGSGEKEGPRSRVQPADPNEYDWARESKVGNAGEDLQLSARHRRNQWRSLEEAEANGTAEKLLGRDVLLAASPVPLGDGLTPANAVHRLVAHLALKSFPPKPYTDREIQGYEKAARRQAIYRPNGGGHKFHSREELRRQYEQAFTIVRDQVARSLAAKRLEGSGDPFVIANEVNNTVGSLIREMRLQRPLEGKHGRQDPYRPVDPYHPVANALVDYQKRLSNRSRSSNGVVGQLAAFQQGLKQATGADWEAARGGDAAARERVGVSTQRHALRVLEGASIGAAFGATGGSGGKRRPRYDPDANFHSIPPRRVGGRPLPDRSQTGMKDLLVKRMGFRGIQFGNSMTDGERADHLRRSAEAMVDLADATGLPVSALGLKVGERNGVGLAFGARGRGGAAAHYEPDLNVINLTRASGVGSLAHEWGHALDSALAYENRQQKGGKAVPGALLSSSTPPLRFIERMQNGGPELYGGPPTKTVTLMAKMVDAMETSGYAKRVDDYIADLKKMGLQVDEKYYRSKHEMFARAFEAHVVMELEAKGRANGYLVREGKNVDRMWPSPEQAKTMGPVMRELLAHVRQTTFASIPDDRLDSREERIRWLVAHLTASGR